MASNSNSGQKFISRNRKPRVHITYEDPYDAERLVELPFVMGVMADLSGNASTVAKPDMNDRSTSIWTTSTSAWRRSNRA
jgi:type VI secretion system protein ImpB